MSSSHTQVDVASIFHKFPARVKYLWTLNWIICLCISELEQLYRKNYTADQPTLFLNSEFKISNIWTQVYFMQNYLIGGDNSKKNNKMFCALCVFWGACSVADFLARLFCCLIVSRTKLFLFFQSFIQLFRFSLSLLPRNSGMFNFRTIRKKKKKKKLPQKWHPLPRQPSLMNFVKWKFWMFVCSNGKHGLFYMLILPQ